MLKDDKKNKQKNTKGQCYTGIYFMANNWNQHQINLNYCCLWMMMYTLYKKSGNGTHSPTRVQSPHKSTLK